jgi:hypothetical protein
MAQYDVHVVYPFYTEFGEEPYPKLLRLFEVPPGSDLVLPGGCSQIQEEDWNSLVEAVSDTPAEKKKKDDGEETEHDRKVKKARKEKKVKDDLQITIEEDLR